MASFRRKIIDNTIEKRIVTGAIVDDEYLLFLKRLYNKKYFKISFANTVLKWVFNYYSKYNRAPRAEIEELYRENKRSLKKSEADIVKEFLYKLSKQHEQEQVFNREYLLDQTKKYFKERSLKLLFTEGKSLLKKGNTDQVEKLLDSHKQSCQLTTNWVNPLDPKYIKSVYSKKDQRELFILPGELGRLIGPFRREWFVAYFGPMKRGKTFQLKDFEILALTNRALGKGLKVASISLEMPHEDNSMRTWHRITGLPEEEKQYIKYPVFDCAKNQTGTCTFKKTNSNKGKLSLFDKNGEKLIFSPDMIYKHCNYCRFKTNKRHKGKFEPTIWWQAKKRYKMEEKDVLKKARSIRKKFGNNFRHRSFPAYTASLQDIKRELNDLEYMENFVPDVICIDYADILKTSLQGRDGSDEIWKGLKGMAGERKCLVVSASQTNRKSIGKNRIGQVDVSDDIRKLAHIDLGMGINQNDIEKDYGVMRINFLAFRHKKSMENLEVTVLQNLDVGNPLLDSMIIKGGLKL